MSTLLVGCFTDDSGAGGLRLFDADGPVLTAVSEAACESPGWLVQADDRIIAAAHAGDSEVAWITVEGSTITVGPSRGTAGKDGCHAEVSPDGSAVAVAHYTSGSVGVVPLVEGGWGDATVVRFTGHSSVNPERQDAPHAHQAVWLDDEHLLVCDLGADMVRIVRWRDDHLREVGSIATTPGFGPRHLVLRRETKQKAGSSAPAEPRVQIAVGGELNGDVASYRHTGSDWTKGWERVSQVQATMVGGSQPSGLRLLGRRTLVIANRAINTLGILEWHDSGQLILTDEFDCGGDHPRDLIVHEDRIWVANQDSGDVCCFTREGDNQSSVWRLASRTDVPRPGALLFV